MSYILSPKLPSWETTICTLHKCAVLCTQIISRMEVNGEGWRMVFVFICTHFLFNLGKGPICFISIQGGEIGWALLSLGSFGHDITVACLPQCPQGPRRSQKAMDLRELWTQGSAQLTSGTGLTTPLNLHTITSRTSSLKDPYSWCISHWCLKKRPADGELVRINN